MVIGLIYSNVMSITSAKFHDTLSGLFSQLPIADLMSNSKSRKNESLISENKRLQNQNQTFKKKDKLRKIKLIKAQNITKRVALRTTKNISLNASSIFAESVPYLGIGVILAVTASDIYDGCETIKDSNELLSLFNAEELKRQENTVCGMDIPTEKEVIETLNQYKRDIDEIIGGTISEMLN